MVGMWRAFEFDLAGSGRKMTGPLEFILTSVEKRPALDAVFLSRQVVNNRVETGISEVVIARMHKQCKYPKEIQVQYGVLRTSYRVNGY